MVHAMPKEYYDISYKTYFNDRIKPKMFQGAESYPLYVQVTFDRETSFFKSYYFDLFARPKYDFQETSIAQIDELEGRVINDIISRNKEHFDLYRFSRQYKILCQDVLDTFDRPFRIWLADYLKEDGLSGLGSLLAYSPDEVAGIRVWEDLKEILEPKRFEKMEDKAIRAGPYLPLAMYVRHHSPEGPFCLPLHEWVVLEKNIAIENFIDEKFWLVEFIPILGAIKSVLYPNGF
jgi:hypothetical protein